MRGITLPKLVLVADDDNDTRVLVQGAVELLGCTVLCAASGTEALDICNSHKLDLAILDWMMPGLSGREVCDRLKETEAGRWLPVLFLTARDSLKDKVDALEEGADDYLTKPFNFKELQARVQALLRVRELNLSLQEKNEQLQAMQQLLVEQERQTAVSELAGAAFHTLGQPLAAILLNCHLLKSVSPEDPRFGKAVASIKADARRMTEMLEKIRSVDANKKQAYFGQTAILDTGEE